MNDGYLCSKCNEYFNENEMLINGLCTRCNSKVSVYTIGYKKVIERIIEESVSLDEIEIAKRLLRKFETKTLDLKDIQLVKDIATELGLNAD